jgi:hypothetical protein
VHSVADRRERVLQVNSGGNPVLVSIPRYWARQLTSRDPSMVLG